MTFLKLKKAILIFRQEKLITFSVPYSFDRAEGKAQYKLNFTVSGGGRFTPVNPPPILV